MEIPNEVKAKVFAQYWGQKVKAIVHGAESDTWVEYGRIVHLPLDADDDYEIDDGEGLYHAYVLPENLKLLLRPLSAITDEDALNAYEIYHGNRQATEHAAMVVIETLAIKASVFQYLQSKGYDLPSWLLGGKTLKEAGLAIYEQEQPR